MSRLPGFRLVIALAAAVLGLAGVLKIVAIATNPEWRASAVIAPALFPFLAWAEILVAIVLGWAASERGSHVVPEGAVWLLATAIFAVFGAGACGLALAGHRSCNCFGGWATSPRIAVVIDALLLGGLVVFRPVPVREAVRQAAVWTASRPAAACGTWSGIAAGVLMGSVALGEPRILDGLRGRTDDVVTVAEDPIDIGAVAPDSAQVVDVTIVNRTDAAVEIVGATASCTCTTVTPAAAFPLTLGPHGRVTLPVRIQFPAAAGPFESGFAYFLRHPRQYRAGGRIVATVVDPALAPTAPAADPPAMASQDADRGRATHRGGVSP